MWRLIMSELTGKSMYKGQKILFLSSIKAQIKSIYLGGRKVSSAFFGTGTKPIFRSESARYFLFIQMSKEMWEFEPEGTGEIMFNKVIGGFLPELFTRWQDAGARHLLSIVLFTRMEYERYGSLGRNDFKEADDSEFMIEDGSFVYNDFYRVLVSDIASVQWSAILTQLKRDFKDFLRDVSIQPTPLQDGSSPVRRGPVVDDGVNIERIAGQPAPAGRGNILEAINLASSEFSEEYIDRDLVRTGLSIIIITPGTGVFEVNSDLLSMTTDLLIENGIGIDLVCLSRVPLHSVPLFKYKDASFKRNEAFGKQKDVLAVTRSKFLGQKDRPEDHSSDRLQARQQETPISHSHKVGDEWCYAIPHWVDVSFWSAPLPSSGIEARFKLHDFFPSSSRSFVSRVRMYEVQMMGIMENEVNDINISSLKPSNTPSARDAEADSLGVLQPQGSVSSINSSFRKSENVHTKGPEALSASFSPKSPLSLNNIKSLSSMIHWMEGYDKKVFKCSEREKRVAKTVDQPKVDDLSAFKERTTNHTHAPQSKNVGIARGAGGSSLQFLPTEPGSPLLSSSEQTCRKTSAASMSSRSSVNNAKPTRTMRQSSFGFRGFGGNAPKAMPVAEISSEVAHRGTTLSLGRKQALSSQSKISHVREAQDQGELTQLGKGVSYSTDDGRQHEGFNEHSQPIEIKRPHEKSAFQRTSTYTERPQQEEEGPVFNGQSRSQGDFSSSAERISFTQSVTPWLTVLNPSNPITTSKELSSRLGRWQHVFPRALHASNIKWKSLCSPASVPLTTEGFPPLAQFRTSYETSSYEVSAFDDSVSGHQDHSMWLIMELICARFSRGFQIVLGPLIASALEDPSLENIDIFDEKRFKLWGKTTYMSKGTQIHQLTPLANGVIEIKIHSRGVAKEVSSVLDHASYTYKPKIRTALSDIYELRQIRITSHTQSFDWKCLDLFICEHKELSLDKYPESLQFWRARFVFIPMQSQSGANQGALNANEDNDEEIRLEGIYKLTQIWQRDRYRLSIEEDLRSRQQKVESLNPLDILFRTRNPSAIVTSELHESLSNEPNKQTKELLPESELLDKSNYNLASLAQAMQSEQGIKLRDRRWHWRLHYSCFIGIEFVTWLLENFRDVNDREDAVRLGNELMKEGLFVHVEKRHNFRDGNFFYQLASEYRNVKTENRKSWFPRLSSVPSTPITEGWKNDTAEIIAQPDESGLEDTSTTATEKMHVSKAILSKKMLYDGDRRKKSHRSEVFNLHYDRISSADDCYHIRVGWMNVTPKLIEDAVSSWASAAERHGLRLVELPVNEASRVEEMHAFQNPYTVKLVKKPPEQQWFESFDATGMGSRLNGNHPYQKALLKKFNFVLDLEAAKDFPASVDVSYSWGKPNYRYPQFISRDGILLAQINDDGEFLLLPNRLFNSRGATGRAAPRAAGTTRRDFTGGKVHKSPITISHRSHPSSPFTSPHISPFIRANADIAPGVASHKLITPEIIKQELENFCSDPEALEKFYKEVREKAALDGPKTPLLTVSSSGLNTPSILPLDTT